jgi:nitrile hydratase
MGPIVLEKNEPVFHAPWEGRVYVMHRAMGAWRKWNGHASRHAKEVIPPAEYLRMTYYEKWFTALIELMITAGLVTRSEVETGKPAAGTIKATPPLTAAQVPAFLRGGGGGRRPSVAPLFQVGQQVRTRKMNPTGHTRLPRYARGRVGTIQRDYGVFELPDSVAHSQGEKPQHVYSVRFTARELWGDQAKAQDAVYLDLFDDYLEAAV